jgi:hypothetical protein
MASRCMTTNKPPIRTVGKTMESFCCLSVVISL